MNIVVIGAGQLGSRHLQALGKNKDIKQIFVVDPSENALEVSRQRLQQVKKNDAKVVFLKQIEDFKMEIDVAVMATTVKHRLTSIKMLVKKNKVKNLILEKVAFTSETEFIEAKNIIENNHINAWVNCPRRLYPFYQNLRNTLQTEKDIRISVIGTNYGLGCNGIHYIDLAAMLFNEDDYLIKKNTIDSDIKTSKREGYVEINGIFDIEFSKDKKLYLQCKPDTNNNAPEYKVLISSPNYELEINELNEKIVIRRDKTGLLNGIKYKLLYQSELTGDVVNSIIETGQCELTDFKTSMKLHLPFLNVLNSFYQGVVGNKDLYIPIT